MDDMSGFSNNKLDPEDYYIGDRGYRVFTEKYHLKRGHCCKNGCKHCPYGFKKSAGRIVESKSKSE